LIGSVVRNLHATFAAQRPIGVAMHPGEHPKTAFLLGGLLLLFIGAPAALVVHNLLRLQRGRVLDANSD
jgi:hypothetical protein